MHCPRAAFRFNSDMPLAGNLRGHRTKRRGASKQDSRINACQRQRASTKVSDKLPISASPTHKNKNKKKKTRRQTCKFAWVSSPALPASEHHTHVQAEQRTQAIRIIKQLGSSEHREHAPAQVSGQGGIRPHEAATRPHPNSGGPGL